MDSNQGTSYAITPTSCSEETSNTQGKDHQMIFYVFAFCYESLNARI